MLSENSKFLCSLLTTISNYSPYYTVDTGACQIHNSPHYLPLSTMMNSFLYCFFSAKFALNLQQTFYNYMMEFLKDFFLQFCDSLCLNSNLLQISGELMSLIEKKLLMMEYLLLINKIEF